MDNTARQALIELLSEYVSRNKKQKIHEVLSMRTRRITIVLEDIHKDQNASATLRTCDCLGIQDVHVVENTTSFSIDEDVTMGSSKWLTIHRYRKKNINNTKLCFDTLRKKGYTIIATTPNKRSLSLDDISPRHKTALFFGNEETGLSDYALSRADACLKIPLHGFTPSYNISVSVAITLASLVERLHRSQTGWQLSEREKSELTLSWYRKIVRRSDLIEQKFMDAQLKIES